MGDTIAQTRPALELDSFKRRLKKLKRRKRSRTHRLKRLYKVGLSARVKSSEDEGLGEEDTSKQGRIADIDANEDITLVSTHDEQMFDVDQDLGGEEVFVTQQDKKVVEKEDKEKAKMIEESVKLKKKDQIQLNEERTRTELEKESVKKQKIDKETVELKQLVKIILDKEGVAIDAIPLAVKPPSIVD
nr:hypothetical protein [Tanacetum cinerariifolium]